MDIKPNQIILLLLGIFLFKIAIADNFINITRNTQTDSPYQQEENVRSVASEIPSKK